MAIHADALEIHKKPIKDPNKEEFTETNLTVLIEPTSLCNLNCTYCYKGNKTNKVMAFGVLKKILQDVTLYNESRNMESSFLWHGGEPTLVGVDFFSNSLLKNTVFGCF